jgi:4-diphosphocytidyl-2-C-methyl-D-erythritol kinase
MVTFPNCKINLGLRITGKRSDGFHNLESVFLPVPWFDALEIIEDNELNIFLSGIPVPGADQNNLCIRAWQLLKADFPSLPPVSIYLHKTIPTGAGLGGGSSNGAYMLRLLNEKFSMGLTKEQLSGYALQLGSDCPFFIYNEPLYATGRGEILKPVELNLSGNYLVLINPSIHIPTGWAFGRITPAMPEQSCAEMVKEDPSKWADLGLLNDFEPPVFDAFPLIKKIKEHLLSAGALFASMTGTGSTVYGIFGSEPSLDHSFLPENHMIKVLQL